MKCVEIKIVKNGYILVEDINTRVVSDTYVFENVDSLGSHLAKLQKKEKSNK